MHDVFISYKSDDSALAMKVVKALEENGILCWIAERNIRAGSNYAMDIPSAIKTARFFVLILTEKAQASPWVLKEVDSAITQQKVILPLMVGSFRLSDAMNFLLTGVQYYDAGRDLKGAIGQITAQIREQIQPEPPVETIVPEPVPAAPVSPAPVPPVNGPVCPNCGCLEAEKPIAKKLPGIIKLLLRLGSGAAGGFLGFWIFVFLVVLLKLPDSVTVITVLAGSIGGLILGFRSPEIWEKKSVKGKWKCSRCGTIFPFRDKKAK